MRTHEENSCTSNALVRSFFCIALAAATIPLWWAGFDLLIVKNQELTRDQHPHFSTPPPVERTPWQSPHMAILMAGAEEHSPYNGPKLQPPVHIADADQFAARLRNAAARNGWYVRDTGHYRNMVLVIPAQHAPALEGFEEDPVAWLEQSTENRLPDFIPAEDILSYTIEVHVNGNSPALHTPGIIGLALVLSGCLTITLGIFAGAWTWDAIRQKPRA